MAKEVLTSTPTDNKIALYKKLLAVLKDVRYIQKDGKNNFHNYKYVTEAAVKDKIHEAFMNNGLLFQLSIVDLQETVFGDEKKQHRLVTVKLHYRFIDVDTGEYEEGTSFGSGVDSADKGLYKAIAGGIKYILTSNFLIATGDDPEDDRYETQQAKLEEAEAKKRPATPTHQPHNGSPSPKQDSGVICSTCGETITDYVSSKGKAFTADILIMESKKKYGMPMCAQCQMAKGRQARAGAGARVN